MTSLIKLNDEPQPHDEPQLYDLLAPMLCDLNGLHPMMLSKNRIHLHTSASIAPTFPVETILLFTENLLTPDCDNSAEHRSWIDDHTLWNLTDLQPMI